MHSPKADGIIADAQAKAQELVTQHEIMQKAYAQANDTINAANKQAQEILDSATSGCKQHSFKRNHLYR